MLVMGCDEAGRGPVVGPLVVAGVVFEEGKKKVLKELGIKDSKKLSSKMRERLYDKIIGLSDDYSVVVLSAKQINQMMEIMNLNEIEMNAMVKVINALNFDKCILDLPSNSKSFVKEMEKKMNKGGLIAEHKADDKYLEVGAASIIAKVVRDREIEKIKGKYKEYGDIGSGYPSDVRTVEFLERYYKEKGRFPEEVRLKWSTCERIKEKVNKRTLDMW